MAKGKAEPLEHEILRTAALLSEGDETLNRDDLHRALENVGIDPARATARFHESAQRLAEDVARSGQTVPLSLQQAIAETAPSVLSAKRESLASDDAVLSLLVQRESITNG
jgi:ribosomal protein L12E/L44/L45/RPP1/RPP2